MYCAMSGITVRFLRPKRLSRVFAMKNSKNSRFSSSAQSAPVIDSSTIEEELMNIAPRVYRRKPAIVPPIKAIAANIFDKELLAFPEVLNKEDIFQMNSVVENIERVLNDENETTEGIDARLKKLKIYGAPATGFHGGLESILTERCKYMEALSENVDVAVAVKNHWMGIDAVRIGLRSDRTDAVLSNLATGEIPITVCVKETTPNSPNVTELRCKSYQSIDNTWLVSGEKFVKNCKEGYYVVSCNKDYPLINTLLVDLNAPNVNINANRILFKETPGTLLGDFDYNADDILNSKQHTFMKDVFATNRLCTASICLGLLRKAITVLIAETRNKYSCGKPFYEFELIQNAVYDAVVEMYTIESMIYFTAGLYDQYEDPDLEIECCLSRIYATRQTYRVIGGLIDAIGIDNLPESSLKLLEDARSLMMNEEQNDKLVVYAGLLGLQYGVSRLSEITMQARNPFLHPSVLFKKIFSDRKNMSGNPVLNLNFKDNFHPSLMDHANFLEHAVLRLQYSMERTFFEHGVNIIEHHRAVNRYVDAAIHVYGMMCSLSRASRAYCIGLYNAQNEMVTGCHIVRLKKEIVDKLVTDMVNGFFINMDEERLDISEKALKHGRSHYEHCLERVFF